MFLPINLAQNLAVIFFLFLLGLMVTYVFFPEICLPVNKEPQWHTEKLIESK